MKKLTSAAILVVVGASLASAQVSFTANDLYFGLNDASAPSDYIIDLGQPGVVGVGGSSVVDLSGDISLSVFDSVFTSGPTGVSMGVVGGQNQGQPSPSYDLFVTALRVGGAGVPAVAGSNLSGFNHSQSSIATTEVTLTGNPWPTAGNNVVDSTKSWSAYVSPTFTAHSFYGASGINPSSAIGSSGILYEDLWKATPSSAYSYLGYFTLNLSSGNSSLTFTPQAVPEPTVCSLLGGAGLLLLSLRRQFNRKSA
jgi:hypothetical protein